MSGLTLVTNPKFDKRTLYTVEEKRANFKEFLKIAKKYESVAPVGEYYAYINSDDYNKFADAIAFVWGTQLIECNETEDLEGDTMVVYATK